MWKRKRQVKYADFDLLIHKVGARCFAKVLKSPAGDAATTIRLKQLSRTSSGGSVLSSSTPLEAGAALFKETFKDEVGLCWLKSLAKVADGSGLRLRLRLEVPDLVQLPWECLYSPEGKEFLALQVETPVVRYLPVAAAPSPARAPVPVKVLILAANPQDSAALQIEKEISEIRQALAPLLPRVQIVRLAGRSLVELQERLAECHVLHFIGHGEAGEIFLEGPDGQARSVRVADLSGLLPQKHTLRLAFLNTCQGACIAAEDTFGGVAQALVHRGVPAVIAMRHDIADDAAIVFAATLYQALVGGASLTEAVTRGRKAIFGEHGSDWASPELYLRQRDLEIFPPAPTIRLRTAALVFLVVVLAILGYCWGPRVIAASQCPSPPGVAMRFVKIPPGEFQMGSSSGPDGPIHHVTLTKPFCLGVVEVTQKEWTSVMRSNPSFAEGDDHPVERVSWQEAHDFLRKLNEFDPRGHYRLPTEAEWEYAASDGESGIYGFGDDEERLPKYGNCAGSRSGATMPVGSLLPTTRWKLHDMHGNVAEWVEDFGVYEENPVVDPVAPPRVDGQRGRRGGSFVNNFDHCRAAARSSNFQGKESYDTGFRVVRDPVH
jgi:formylglycine-generating enzyme required for sulfatase activity